MMSILQAPPPPHEYISGFISDIDVHVLQVLQSIKSKRWIRWFPAISVLTLDRPAY